MSNLQQFKADIIIDNLTGESFMSLRGLARAANAPLETLRRGVSNFPTKTAEVQTPGGLQGVSLYREDAIAFAITKFNPTLAAQLMQLGVRSLLHKLADYVHKPPMSQAEAALYTLQLAVENERKLAVVETKVNRLEAFAPVENYYTLTAYFNACHRKWELPASASTVGKALVKRSKELGHEVKKAHDARYNSVNTYHRDVLYDYFGFLVPLT
jgi:hypothetical protein